MGAGWNSTYVIVNTGALLLVLSLAGCGSNVGPTSGVVRFEDGELVQSGSIEFRSIKTHSRKQAASIRADVSNLRI